MEGKERREQLLHILSDHSEPVSGTELAKLLHVSRQVIVQDIALIRANKIEISSTTKGYLLSEEKKIATRRFHVKHTTSEIEDELLTIVDHGGKVLDVIVTHDIYGEIKTALNLKTRQDVYAFVREVAEKRTVPLKELTNSIHYHTVEADSESLLDDIEHALNEKNYLLCES